MTRKQIKQLDILWSKAVKERAGYKCEFCLREDLRLNSCHIVGRRYRGTRWDLQNGLSLCFPHHAEYDQHGPQAKDIFNNLIGENRYDLLRMRAMEVTRNQDFETIKKSLVL